MNKTVLTNILIACLISFHSCTPDDHRKLNIIIILTDDQGYNDAGCYGSPDILTPHLDRMAIEGSRFTDFYVAQPVCTASRVALLTGCYPNRLGMHGALSHSSVIGIHDREETLAEILKNNGYKTAVYGKWHLGYQDQFNPLRHGFDEFYGIPYSNDMWPYHPWQGTVFNFPPLPLYEGMEIIDTLEDQSFLTAAITQRATKFIRDNRDNSFFLYVPHPQPHVPLFVSSDYERRSTRGLYGDVISEIDWSVGEILNTISELNLDENTLVIFLSDNGPWLSYGAHAGSAFPLREGKGTNWDGGVRVPCIMRLPGTIPAGQEVNIPLMTIDLLPTLANMTGSELPELTIDGKDVSEIIRGKSKVSPQEAYAFYYHQNDLQAVRAGDHKLILPHRYRTLKGRPGGTGGLPVDYEYIDLDSMELYNLKRDPGEQVNLVDQLPQVKEELLEHVERFRAELGDNLANREGISRRDPGTIRKDN